MFRLKILKDRTLFWYKDQLVCVGFPADEPDLCFWLEGFEAEVVGAINNYCPRSLIEKLAVGTNSNWGKVGASILKEADEKFLNLSNSVNRYATRSGAYSIYEVYVWAETREQMKMMRLTNTNTGFTAWVQPLDDLIFDID